MSIHFDNGGPCLFGNHLTPKTKTVKVQTEYVNRALVQYNPEIVKATKKRPCPRCCGGKPRTMRLPPKKD